jgi:protein O-mannosyl-transferase
LLPISTILAYWQAYSFAFVNFDDPDYVGRGLTPSNLFWALTSGDAANWFPVTRISHLVDFTLFGAHSGMHHLVSVILHAAAAMLLFAFLNRATGAWKPSAFVAFLFALHPLHVESVAWVAERKDVLSALFGFLTLWAYVSGRRALSLAAFSLGLMSKPMLVSLPLLLLLLDYWPLGWESPRFRGWAAAVRDKAAYFALAAASAAVTWFVQQSTGAVRSVESFPLGLRIENALVSYCTYIVKTFWPVDLAVFYPYPGAIPAWEAALALAILAAITALVWRALLPVIGIIQVGAQARADRYMHLPMTGLAITLAWGVPALLEWARVVRAGMVLAALAVASLGACAATTWVQLSFWQNSETLFQHAVDVTPANYLAEHNLGSYLLDKPGRLEDSVTHLRAALQLRPDYPEALTDLASALAQSPGGLPQAISLYQSAARILPNSTIIRNNLAQAHYDFGISLVKQSLAADSIAQFEAALKLRADDAETHNNLAIALAQTGHAKDAERHFRETLRIKPDYADAHLNLGITLANAGRTAEALTELEVAYRLQPDPELQKEIDRLRHTR